MKSRYSSFIKRFVSIVIVSSALLIQSCSNSEIENWSNQNSQSTVTQNSVFKVYDKTYNTPNGLQIWEAQLNKAIEMDSNMVCNGLKLIRYEHVRQIASITDFESVKTELKNDNSLLIVHKDNSSRFSISENRKYAAKYSNLVDSLLPTSAGVLKAIRSKGDSSLLAKAAYKFKKNDLSVVNLVWQYNGKTQNTQCLVSNEKGIVYDKFLFFICTMVTKTTRNQSNAPKKASLYMAGDGPVSKNFHVEKSAYNFRGDELFLCWVDANLIGERRNGVNFVTICNANRHSDNGVWYSVWKCAAIIGVVSYAPGSSGTNPSGHAGFMWGTTYREGFDVTVGFAGSGISYTGNGTEDGGIVYLNANDMN